VAIEYPTT